MSSSRCRSPPSDISGIGPLRSSDAEETTDVAPHWRFSPGVSVETLFRVFRKFADTEFNPQSEQRRTSSMNEHQAVRYYVCSNGPSSRASSAFLYSDEPFAGLAPRHTCWRGAKPVSSCSATRTLCSPGDKTYRHRLRFRCVRPSGQFGCHMDQPGGIGVFQHPQRDKSGPCSTSRMRGPILSVSPVLAPPWPSKIMRLSVIRLRSAG